ncbi:MULTISPECIES: hypothetical protein [unclassified Streptomyces]|uniref:hypothetical protein n=1 Tax=unclassified Streptomyces TaxID=2593676 RepID=UPI002E248D56
MSNPVSSPPLDSPRASLLWTAKVLVSLGGQDDARPVPEKELADIARGLTAIDHAFREQPCDHGWHPCEDTFGDLTDALAEGDTDSLDETEEDPLAAKCEEITQLLPLLAAHGHAADAVDGWDGSAGEPEVWLCPRTAAGFARAAGELATGRRHADWPRLAEPDLERMSDLRSIAWDYPNCDPEVALSSLGDELAAAPEDASRAGLLLCLTALGDYAGSGRIVERATLDDMIDGFEAVIPALRRESSAADCPHGPHGHPVFGDGDPADDIATGVLLAAPEGRALYDLAFRRGAVVASPGSVQCPAFLLPLAEHARERTRADRDRLFGRQDLRDGQEQGPDE